MTKMLKATDAVSFARHKLYATWAKRMVESPPPPGEQLKILNEAWKVRCYVVGARTTLPTVAANIVGQMGYA